MCMRACVCVFVIMAKGYDLVFNMHCSTLELVQHLPYGNKSRILWKRCSLRGAVNPDKMHSLHGNSVYSTDFHATIYGCFSLIIQLTQLLSFDLHILREGGGNIENVLSQYSPFRKCRSKCSNCVSRVIKLKQP